MASLKNQRFWKELTKKRLEEIRDDTVKDAPSGDYCAAEVYDIVCELLRLRELSAESIKGR